jgi:hypothetical protein
LEGTVDRCPFLLGEEMRRSTGSTFIRRLKMSEVDVKIQSFLKGYKRLWKVKDGIN